MHPLAPAPLRARARGPRPAARALLACLVAGLLAAGCGDDPQGRLDEARALQDGGDFAASLPILEAVLAQDPDHAEANYRRGLALLSTGEPNRAVWYLRRVPLEGEFGTEAALLLGNQLLRARNYEESEATASRILDAHPDEIRAVGLRAQVRMQRNDHEAALEDVERALRIDPESLESMGMRGVLLQRVGRPKDALEAYQDFEKKAAERKSPLAGGACLAVVSLAVKGADAAVAGVNRCADLHGLNAPEGELAASILDQVGRGDDATALLRAQLQKGEENQNLRLRNVLVTRLLRLGRRDEAAAELEPLTKGADSAAEWMIVGNLQREAGRREEALASYRRAAELDPKLLAAQHTACDLLVELGRLEEAEAQAAQIPDPTLRDLVLGHAALGRGDAQRALQLLNAALLQWPANQGGRLLAARAALQLGRLDEGVAHLREAARASGGKGEPVLLLAHLTYARGDYVQAGQLLDSYMSKRKPDPAKVIELTPDKESDAVPEKIAPEARVLLAKLGVAVNQYQAAREALEPLRAEAPARYAVEMSRVTGVEKDADAALAELEARSLDWAAPEQEAALRERVQLAVRTGKPERAAAFLQRLAAQDPGAVQVAVAQALLGLASGDLAAAAAAAERAAALAPDDPRVLGAQGSLARMQGDLERSRTLLERAVAAAPREPGHQYELAQTLAQLGREEDAEARLRDLMIMQPDYAPAANDLAWMLAKNGEDLALAEDLALRAVRALPVPEVRDTLGFVQLKRGSYDAAILTLEGVRDERPAYSTARYHLALALAGGGRSDQARDELRAALAGPPFPEAELARTELARLEQGEVR